MEDTTPLYTLQLPAMANNIKDEVKEAQRAQNETKQVPKGDDAQTEYWACYSHAA